MKKTKFYLDFQNSLFEISDDVSRILSGLKSLPDTTSDLFEKWSRLCGQIYCQVSEEVVRVAIVGTIKSGKSTFVNALFRGDFVRRGAGVITSIVTKIRSGQSNKAKLYFKSWDEVNRDMKQAMKLFPHFDASEWERHFDIRREEDRKDVNDVLDAQGTDTLFNKDTRETNSVLLSCYLRGYNRVRHLLSSDPVAKVYHGAHFDQHRDFVGDQTLAVYLKDVHLEIDCNRFESSIEIADCQGSDSPNPLHLTMIQDYLFKTHLIVYIISSRTGLREADIRFLSMIRRMGILDNTLFIVNCDLNEHDSVEDFIRVIDTVKEELSLLTTKPRLYGFSTLLNLFEAAVERLSKKDRSRLDQWRTDDALVSYSNQQTTRFDAAFLKRVHKKRYATLVTNHVERLKVMVAGIDHWLNIHQDVLRRDNSDAQTLVNNVKEHMTRMNQTQTTLKSALEGVIAKLKNELRQDTDRFFDHHTGPVVPQLVKFIETCQITDHGPVKQLNVSGFANSMYSLFLQLKQTLDAYMAETVNPEIIRFLKNVEHQIMRRMASVAESYDGMARKAFVEYQTVLESNGLPNPGHSGNPISLTDIQYIKEMEGIDAPSIRVSLQYSARIKTEAIMNFGVYSLASLIEKLIKRPVLDDNIKEARALKKGVLSLKREMIQSILTHFKDFNENIKFQYVFKLIEAVAKNLRSSLTECFENETASLKSLGQQINRSRSDKETFLTKINKYENEVKKVSRKIAGLTETITMTES